MDFKKILLFVGAGIALTLGWFLLSGEPQITNYPPRGNTIVAFGDSLVEGVGTTAGNDFVSQVSRRIGVPIKNFGRSGDTTGNALARIESVLTAEPDIVLILLGGNDALRRVPIEETRANLAEIIFRFQRAGAITVVLGVPGGLLSDSFAKMYKSLTRETGSVYVENILKGVFGNPKYMDDSIHPNDEGAVIMADKVAPALERLLSVK